MNLVPAASGHSTSLCHSTALRKLSQSGEPQAVPMGIRHDDTGLLRDQRSEQSDGRNEKKARKLSFTAQAQIR